MEAARLASIHEDVVAMAMGYETPLTEGGQSLSGRQRQRLSTEERNQSVGRTRGLV
jgi:ABC-type bacteriocin/lantibiotic exporter with double-glycine peptidase domain